MWQGESKTITQGASGGRGIPAAQNYFRGQLHFPPSPNSVLAIDFYFLTLPNMSLNQNL